MKEENTMTTEERAAAEAAAEQTAEAAAEQTAAETEAEAEAPAKAALPEKFRSVDALVKAYEALEAEFTRRSQRLRALEQANKAPRAQGGVLARSDGVRAGTKRLLVRRS